MAELARASYLIDSLSMLKAEVSNLGHPETFIFVSECRFRELINSIFGWEAIMESLMGGPRCNRRMDHLYLYLAESFVSTIVGGRPVKIRLEDKIAQKWNFSRTGSIEADFKCGKKTNERNVVIMYHNYI